MSHPYPTYDPDNSYPDDERISLSSAVYEMYDPYQENVVRPFLERMMVEKSENYQRFD